MKATKNLGTSLSLMQLPLVLAVVLFARTTTVSAAPDFNGDGRDDLAVGVPNEAVVAIDAGTVNVIYGSASGLQAGRLNHDNQLWNQNSPSVDTGGADNACESNDVFGSSIGIGDFNNDGYDDLAIGVPNENVGSVADAGAVNVLYGSASGLQATGVGGPNDQFWHQDSSGIADTAEISDHFGSALCGGDFNGDGYDDLAIGVSGEDAFRGAVSVLYGGPSGLRTTADQSWDQGGDVADQGEEGDHFGDALSCADFDGDGMADLAIGVPFEGIDDELEAGAVNVIYGSPAGLQATGVGGLNDQFWHQDVDDVLDVADEDNHFGIALASNDFNGDNYDDIAIGVPNESVADGGVKFEAGAVNVLYGSAGGLQATGTGGPIDQFWHQGFSDVENNAETDDHLGSAVNSCDFNGDGYADLGMGVPDESFSSNSAGAVNVLYGSPDGLSTGGVVGGVPIPNDQFWNQGTSTDDVADSREALDRFGYALGCSDFNGSGHDDLAVGVPGEQITVGGINQTDAGAVNALYGSSSGLQSSGTGGPNDQFWHQDRPLVKDSVEAGDFFGAALPR